MSKIKEIQQAILRGDSEWKGIKLPKPQSVGTMTQIATYAHLATLKISEKL